MPKKRKPGGDKLFKHLENPIIRLIYIIGSVAIAAGFTWANLTNDVDKNTSIISEVKIEVDAHLSDKDFHQSTLNSTHRENKDIHMPYMETAEKFIPREEVDILMKGVEAEIRSVQTNMDTRFDALEKLLKQSLENNK